MELVCIVDYLVCNSVIGVDIGALIGFVYIFQECEFIYEIYEEICGVCLIINIGRIGGFECDFSFKVIDKIREFLKRFEKVLIEFENLFLCNRIFMDRIIKVGGISGERVLLYGFIGPNLRVAGVDYDV